MNNIPMPEPRIHTRRLPDAARSLEVGQWIDADYQTMQCIRHFMTHIGWKPVSKKLGENLYRVWRYQ